MDIKDIEPLLIKTDTPPAAFLDARRETTLGYREMVTALYPPAAEWEDANEYYLKGAEGD